MSAPASLPTTEGRLPFVVGSETFETYYKVFGVPSSGIPLVTLHGGPGSAHYYILPMSDLASPTRAVIFYDQIGTGNSTHLRDKPAEFWTPQLFMDELANLLSKLGIAGQYDLLGHSWGGMLGSQFASTFSGPEVKGLRRLILSSSPASMELFQRSCARLIKQLPEDVQATLKKHEDAGTTDSKEYEDAVGVFYERHLCRVKPMPDDVVKSFGCMAEDPTVYHTMNGPSEFHITGSLRSWTIIPSISSIKVPTLLINGAYDEAQEDSLQPFFDKIPRVKWAVLAESSHMGHFEERERYMRIVGDFLGNKQT